MKMKNAMIKCEPPSQLIYEFNGIFSTAVGRSEVKEALSLDNTLWADTVLASHGYVIGVVVYSGR